MAFVLEDVINEIEESRSLEPLKKLKKRKPCSSRCPLRHNPSCQCNKIPLKTT